jgi:serine/threonine protein kinase
MSHIANRPNGLSLAPDGGPADQPSCSDDSRVLAAVREYLTLIEAGQAPDRAAFVKRFPEVAGVLSECLGGLAFVQAVAPELSQPVEGGAKPATGESLTGTLGDFRLLRVVGRGGMGVVYEAEQILLGRRVALKVLPFAATMDPRQLQRFQNEARAAASLEHPHIVPVYGVGCERGVHYYAMKFIDGQSLAGLIDAQRQSSTPRSSARGETAAFLDGHGSDSTSPRAALSTQRAPRDAAAFRQIATWGLQAAEALEYAHRVGIVHRDIKPANLMIDAQGALWLTDFGLARTTTEAGLTLTGDVLGTLRYMSPEQALARHGLVDHRTDVYSLGATLYELLTLEPAFASADRNELLRQIAFDEPRAPRRRNKGIPAELETIVLKALEKNPADRYATAQEMGEDLRRFVQDEPIRARRATLTQQARKWARRHKSLMRLVAAGLVIAVVALAVSTILIRRERNEALRQRDLALEQRRLARQAVDKMYLQVAEKWLYRQPHMKQLQLEFLQEALGFYQQFAREQEAEPEARYQAAIAYQRVGSILNYAFSDKERAREALAEAAAILARLAEESPSTPDYSFELARTYMALGHVQDGDTVQEESYMRRAVAFLEPLVERFPEETRYPLLLAKSLTNLTNPLMYAGRWQEAEPVTRWALSILEALVQEGSPNAEYLRLMAGCHHDLGLIQARRGQVPQGIGNLREAVGCLERLSSNTSDLPEYQHGLRPWDWHNFGAFYLDLAHVLARTGDLRGAQGTLDRAIRIHEKLVYDFPRMPEFRESLFSEYRDRGDLWWKASQSQLAEQAYQQALAVGENMILAFPSAAGLHQKLGRFLITCPHPRFRDAHRGIELAKSSVTRAPKSARHRNALGEAHYRARDYPAALAALKESIQLKNGGDSSDWFLLAMAHWRLGRKEEAHGWYDKAVDWMDKNQPGNDELCRFRAEAAEVLGITEAQELLPPPNPGGEP